MAGIDPIDSGIASLTNTSNVSKPDVRAELLAVPRSFTTAANVATWNLAGRTIIYIAEYRRFFAKNTADITSAISESLVRDINGLAFEVTDASAERVSFSANKGGTDQTGIATATPTPLTFGTEEFDEGGYYDAATGRFTPPAGAYAFAVEVGYSGGIVDQARLGFYIYKNGAAQKLFIRSASGTGTVNVPGVCILEADGDDYFQVYAYAEGTGNKTVLGQATYTYFSAFKIDGQRGNDGTSFSADVIVADITERDTHGSDSVGTRVAVSNIGDDRSAVYELLSTGPAVWSSPVYLSGVTAASNFGTDNRLVRSDGVTKGVQATGISVDDSDNVSGVGTLTTSGLLTLSGGQIAFPASQNASVDPNTLDDYEEGTFTPTLSFGGGSTGITYSTQTGKYTKVGNVVTIGGRVHLTSKGSSTGSAQVNGLPFTASSFDTVPIAYQGNALASSATTQCIAQLGASSTTINLLKFAAGTASNMVDTDFTNGSVTRFGGSYLV